VTFENIFYLSQTIAAFAIYPDVTRAWVSGLDDFAALSQLWPFEQRS
jgi:hypothetical protein